MINYIVKEEDKVVVAIISDSSLDAVNKILKRMSSINGLVAEVLTEDEVGVNILDVFDLNSAIMPNKFVGVAKCCEQDEFDVEVGKKVAASKAKEKYHRCLKRKVNTWVNNRMKQLNNVLIK